jgi:hypothetical protein
MLNDVEQIGERAPVPLFEDVARGAPSGAMCSGVWLTEPQPRASINLQPKSALWRAVEGSIRQVL